MEKKDLEKMTLPKLREEALKYKDQIPGAIHGMKKNELVYALMEVLGIKEKEEEEEKVAKKKSKKDKKIPSKESLKKDILAFKKEKNEALKEKEKGKVKILRRKIKILKRKIRHLTEAA